MRHERTITLFALTAKLRTWIKLMQLSYSFVVVKKGLHCAGQKVFANSWNIALLVWKFICVHNLDRDAIWTRNKCHCKQADGQCKVRYTTQSFKTGSLHYFTRLLSPWNVEKYPRKSISEWGRESSLAASAVAAFEAAAKICGVLTIPCLGLHLKWVIPIPMDPLSTLICFSMNLYRDEKISLYVVWWSLLLLLLITSASTCLQHSRNHVQRNFLSSVDVT